MQPYLKFWGTRGSTPICEKESQHYGGNTCCLEVSTPLTCLIIDAGTGIRKLGDELCKKNVDEIHIFFTHAHLDHLIGLPFFKPLYCEKKIIHFWCPQQERSFKSIIETLFLPETFPVGLNDFKAQIHFHDVIEGHPILLNDVQIESYPCFHPGKTLAYKLDYQNFKVGYCSDNEFLGELEPSNNITDSLIEPYQSFIDFFKNCDLLIHEAQYTVNEYKKKKGWGHSSLINAAWLIYLTQTKRWVITHHDPSYDDKTLDENKKFAEVFLKEKKLNCKIELAYDGFEIFLNNKSEH
ncbi:MAG: MBL fold metallo-hydrolase [Parachlamydiales bacterium]|nr:MBL fold metallo-hydrolase [Parachlamydiales bacterium]